jgi:uncharacterized protein (TIGR02266 family)
LIKYRSADQFFSDYIQNISRGGIFVPTQQPLPDNTLLQISFSLPHYDRLITTEGIVVHSVNADAECAESPAGMGIQFKALSEENQQLIDAYIESRL